MIPIFIFHRIDAFSALVLFTAERIYTFTAYKGLQYCTRTICIYLLPLVAYYFTGIAKNSFPNDYRKDTLL